MRMEPWRRFERTRGGTREFWQIRREGIRCFISWGRDGGRGNATTVALDDDDHARRHAEKKIREKVGDGYVEVAAAPAPAGDTAALVVDTIADARHKPAHGLPRPEYLPVEGFPDVVCHAQVYAASPNRGFYHYLVLRDAGRSAIAVNVGESSHRPASVAALLELLVTVRDLPFDGSSHHKLPLPRPAGPFSHALLCSPALGRAAAAYPSIASRVALAFPIHDCEIGDADPEVFVDARTRGHGSLRFADWDRQPQPVVDLRYDIHAGRRHRNATFKVFQRSNLDRLLAILGGAGPESWLEIRSFRGDVTRLTPATAGADIDRFLLGR
jgi:predicted DNA-binding WGR domain protein